MIVNLPASAPPLMLYAGTPPSMSLEVTVVTAVEFSATFTLAVVPPPLLVITGASFTAAPVIPLLPVTGAATPSLTLVEMLNPLLKSAAGVKVRLASRVLTSAMAPLADQTPAAKVEVTLPEVPVLRLPAATFDKVKVAVTLTLSRSPMTMSVRLRAVSSV